MEAGELLKEKVPARIAIAEALAFGPDAGIHHTDDDSLASAGILLVSQTAELIPKAVRSIQTEKRGGAGSLQSQGFVFVHGHDPSLFRESGGLLRGDFGGETVEGESVGIQLLAIADFGESRVMFGFQVIDIFYHLRSEWVDLLAFFWGGGLIASDSALISNRRSVLHLDDIDAVAGL